MAIGKTSTACSATTEIPKIKEKHINVGNTLKSIISLVLCYFSLFLVVIIEPVDILSQVNFVETLIYLFLRIVFPIKYYFETDIQLVSKVIVINFSHFR